MHGHASRENREGLWSDAGAVSGLRPFRAADALSPAALLQDLFARSETNAVTLQLRRRACRFGGSGRPLRRRAIRARAARAPARGAFRGSLRGSAARAARSR